jgi:hypothetical protein
MQQAWGSQGAVWIHLIALEGFLGNGGPRRDWKEQGIPKLPPSYSGAPWRMFRPRNHHGHILILRERENWVSEGHLSIILLQCKSIMSWVWPEAISPAGKLERKREDKQEVLLSVSRENLQKLKWALTVRENAKGIQGKIRILLSVTYMSSIFYCNLPHPSYSSQLTIRIRKLEHYTPGQGVSPHGNHTAPLINTSVRSYSFSGSYEYEIRINRIRIRKRGSLSRPTTAYCGLAS